MKRSNNSKLLIRSILAGALVFPFVTQAARAVEAIIAPMSGTRGLVQAMRGDRSRIVALSAGPVVEVPLGESDEGRHRRIGMRGSQFLGDSVPELGIALRLGAPVLKFKAGSIVSTVQLSVDRKERFWSADDEQGLWSYALKIGADAELALFSGAWGRVYAVIPLAIRSKLGVVSSSLRSSGYSYFLGSVASGAGVSVALSSLGQLGISGQIEVPVVGDSDVDLGNNQIRLTTYWSIPI